MIFFCCVLIEFLVWSTDEYYEKTKSTTESQSETNKSEEQIQSQQQQQHSQQHSQQREQTSTNVLSTSQ
jgi:hypothetical protein